MISKLGPQIVYSRLVVAELPSGTADRFVELTEAVLGLDDVEVLPVSLRQGVRVGEAMRVNLHFSV